MLRSALIDTLSQIEEILDAILKLPDNQTAVLYIDTRVGSHVRHALDHYKALLLLEDSDVVDYNLRSRQSPMETDVDAAKREIAIIREQLCMFTYKDRSVRVVSEISCSETEVGEFESFLFREILWVVNHTIHHAAMIKVLLGQRGLCLADHIGLAPATASYERGND